MELAQIQVPIRRKKFHTIDTGLRSERSLTFQIKRGKQIKSITLTVNVIAPNLKYNATGGGFDFLADNRILVPDIGDDNFY